MFFCCGKNAKDSALEDQPKPKPVASRQQDVVREGYAATAKGSGSCCAVTGVDGKQMGYTAADFKMGGLTAEDQAKLLGCGNPVPLAAVQPGETVLDLGCGKGLDCFLVAEATGPTGKVIGVDMTPEMLAEARKRAVDLGKKNCSFRLGELEALPLPDNTVDVVISNCVINLCPDKSIVYAEIMRVLRPGGRIAISDVVTTKELPQALKTAEALVCWVAGAPSATDVEPLLLAAGFGNVVVKLKEESREFIKNWLPGSGCENFVVSAEITARKPNKSGSEVQPEAAAATAQKEEEDGGCWD